MRRISGLRVAGTIRSMSLWGALLAAISVLGPLSSAPAAITTTGNVSPADPSTWDDSTTGYIGKTAAGTLTVNAGSGLHSSNGYIGLSSAATGQVTISGPGSSWTNSNELYVSYNGSGVLSIANGGLVSSSSSYIGGANGQVTVDGAARPACPARLPQPLPATHSTPVTSVAGRSP